MAGALNGETTLALVREFDAEPAQVFFAFLDARVLRTMWNSDAYPIEELAVDPREGGGWKLAMRNRASGTVAHCHARFETIAPHRRIVWWTKWQEGDMAALPEMRVTLEFEAIESGTRLSLVHEFFPDAITRDHHGQGWGSGLDRLAGILSPQSTDLQPIGDLTMQDSSPIASSGAFTVIREFDAPRELVWKAWTESEHLTRWWGPAVFTTPVFNVDLRIGGRMHFCMRSPEGHEFWCAGEYTVIDPPAHLASTSYFSNAEGERISPQTFGFDPEWPEETTIDITLEDLGGRTRLTMTQTGVTFAMARKIMADQGWNEQFDKLAAYLPHLG